MQANLSLANLHELDNGAAGLVIDDAIRKAVADLDDRGDDGKPRLVNIVVSLQKIPERRLPDARRGGGEAAQAPHRQHAGHHEAGEDGRDRASVPDALAGEPLPDHPRHAGAEEG